MTEQQEKAFQGRWRFKGFDEYEVRQLSGRDVRDLCRDFFEAGILLSEPRPLQGDSIAAPPVTVCCDSVATTPTFEDFWNAYDKKVGREKAEKLWNKMTPRQKHDCIQYVPLYVRSQPDKQYRKNPETFLRNHSWQDEIIIRDNPHQQRIERIRQAASVIAGYDSQD